MTHKEVLELIPDKDIRDKAIAYTPKHRLESDCNENNIGNAIGQSFLFSSTSEGGEYWSKIAISYFKISV